MISIIVTMGFINQDNTELPELGDEFDHLIGVLDARSPVEIVVVDRAWPRRWSRMVRVLGGSGVSIKYVPPKPSPFIDCGYRAVCAMRNSGAIVSSGRVLVFVDDFFLIDPVAIDSMWEAYQKDETLLCPVHRQDAFPHGMPEGDQEFSGHNPGIYMCSREQFMALGGFNENFDGAYGEEDTEWQNRLDRLLDTTAQYKLRRRRRGIIWRRTYHTNGATPQALQYPWRSLFPDMLTSRDDLRCNKAFYKFVAAPRIENGILDTTGRPSDEEIQALTGSVCHDGCMVCNRADREHQIQSYHTMMADHQVRTKMEIFQLQDGVSKTFFDPWAGER